MANTEMDNTSISSTKFPVFECVKCNYKTTKKGNWVKHATTKKHMESELTERFKCSSCDKTYKDKSGLWRHSKQCTSTQLKTETEIAHLTSIIVNQNKIIVEQSHEITELAKKGMDNAGTHNNSHNMTNSNNTHFNLQFFLNETCKDAINFKDFIKSIIIELSDLKNMQTMGYSDGMSNIIVNALDSLDTNKRPIHCSDLKRETMYIKEDGVWEKDNETKTNVKDMIRSVEQKNVVKIPEWVKDNPACVKSDNRANSDYLKMVVQVTGGDLHKTKENVDKIIHNIAKNVTIDKSTDKADDLL